MKWFYIMNLCNINRFSQIFTCIIIYLVEPKKKIYGKIVENVLKCFVFFVKNFSIDFLVNLWKTTNANYSNAKPHPPPSPSSILHPPSSHPPSLHPSILTCWRWSPKWPGGGSWKASGGRGPRVRATDGRVGEWWSTVFLSPHIFPINYLPFFFPFSTIFPSSKKKTKE